MKARISGRNDNLNILHYCTLMYTVLNKAVLPVYNVKRIMMICCCGNVIAMAILLVSFRFYSTSSFSSKGFTLLRKHIRRVSMIVNLKNGHNFLQLKNLLSLLYRD